MKSMLIVRLLVLLALSLSFVACSEPKVGTAEGDKAPDFTVEDVSTGQKVKLSDLKGKVVLIDFWATWCGPCRMLEPEIQRIVDKYGDKDFAVLGISNESKKEIKDFALKREHTYPIHHDFAGMANGAFKVDSLPTQVLVGKDGRILWVQKGFGEGDLTEAVEKAMG